MISIMHMPWIGRELEVIGSFDPTYVGRKGLVVEETQRTLTINEEGRKICLPKQEINFKICLLYTSPSPRDLSTSRMPSSA